MVRQKWPVLEGSIQNANQDQHQDFAGIGLNFKINSYLKNTQYNYFY